MFFFYICTHIFSKDTAFTNAINLKSSLYKCTGTYVQVIIYSKGNT